MAVLGKVFNLRCGASTVVVKQSVTYGKLLLNDAGCFSIYVFVSSLVSRRSVLHGDAFVLGVFRDDVFDSSPRCVPPVAHYTPSSHPPGDVREEHHGPRAPDLLLSFFFLRRL